MDSVRAAGQRSLDDPIPVQIRISRRRIANMNGGVGHKDVVRQTIRRAVHRGRGDLPVTAGVHDPHRRDAAVRHKHFVDGALHTDPAFCIQYCSTWFRPMLPLKRAKEAKLPRSPVPHAAACAPAQPGRVYRRGRNKKDRGECRPPHLPGLLLNVEPDNAPPRKSRYLRGRAAKPRLMLRICLQV